MVKTIDQNELQGMIYLQVGVYEYIKVLLLEKELASRKFMKGK